MRVDFALLIIDVLVDFFERVPELSAQRARLVAATNQLTEAVRGAGQPVQRFSSLPLSDLITGLDVVFDFHPHRSAVASISHDLKGG